MLPPDIITTTFLFLVFIFLLRTAAAATAPPGSVIIFKFSARVIIVFFTSSSDTIRPPFRVDWFIANVNLPGWEASKASQIDLFPGKLLIILPFSNDFLVSSKSSGSTL